MNQFAARIERNIHRASTKSGREVFEETLFYISEGTNTSAADLINLPIPLVLSLSDELTNLNKAKIKANKKASRR